MSQSDCVHLSSVALCLCFVPDVGAGTATERPRNSATRVSGKRSPLHAHPSPPTLECLICTLSHVVWPSVPRCALLSQSAASTNTLREEHSSATYHKIKQGLLSALSFDIVHNYRYTMHPRQPIQPTQPTHHNSLLPSHQFELGQSTVRIHTIS